MKILETNRWKWHHLLQSRWCMIKTCIVWRTRYAWIHLGPSHCTVGETFTSLIGIVKCEFEESHARGHHVLLNFQFSTHISDTTVDG